jgi:hypothetical protein
LDSNPEFDSMFQVDVACISTSVSPLSLWERARERARVRATIST